AALPELGQGIAYIAWRNFHNPANTNLVGGIRFVRSTDGGVSWGPDQGLLIAPEGEFNVQGAYVTVGADHTVYVFWLDQSAGDGTSNLVRVRKSNDHGLTFDDPITVATLQNHEVNGELNLNGGFRSNSFIQAAVNPISGHIYVVFGDLGPTGDQGD